MFFQIVPDIQNVAFDNLKTTAIFKTMCVMTSLMFLGMLGYLGFKGAKWIAKTVYQKRTSISNSIYQAYNLPETLYQRVRVDGKRDYR